MTQGKGINSGVTMQLKLILDLPAATGWPLGFVPTTARVVFTPRQARACKAVQDGLAAAGVTNADNPARAISHLMDRVADAIEAQQK